MIVISCNEVITHQYTVAVYIQTTNTTKPLREGLSLGYLQQLLLFDAVVKPKSKSLFRNAAYIYETICHFFRVNDLLTIVCKQHLSSSGGLKQ